MKRFLDDLDSKPLPFRTYLLRVLFLELAVTLLLGGLDLALVLGGGPAVGTPFVPAAWGAGCAFVTALILYVSRGMSDEAFNRAAQDAGSGGSGDRDLSRIYGARKDAPDGTTD